MKVIDFRAAKNRKDMEKTFKLVLDQAEHLFNLGQGKVALPLCTFVVLECLKSRAFEAGEIQIIAKGAEIFGKADPDGT